MNVIRKSILVSLLLMIPFSLLFSQNKKGDILGKWLNQEEDAQVEMFERNGKIYGKLVWLKNPIDDDTGKAKLDKNNPDDELKKKPLMGLEILKGFTFDGDDEWEGGEIYDPNNGKTYSCYMTFAEKDKLKIRGYIGVSLLGRTTYWTRVE
jgi:uncharacterized protein (DUF2147 family)